MNQTQQIRQINPKTGRPKTELELKLDACEAARLEHETQHGSPDNYNGVEVNPVNGKKYRLHAYSPAWYKSYDKWSAAYDAIFSSVR